MCASSSLNSYSSAVWIMSGVENGVCFSKELEKETLEKGFGYYRKLLCEDMFTGPFLFKDSQTHNKCVQF